MEICVSDKVRTLIHLLRNKYCVYKCVFVGDCVRVNMDFGGEILLQIMVKFVYLLCFLISFHHGLICLVL